MAKGKRQTKSTVFETTGRTLSLFGKKRRINKKISSRYEKSFPYYRTIMQG